MYLFRQVLYSLPEITACLANVVRVFQSAPIMQ